MPKEQIRAEWAVRIETFNASGKTQAAFCKENGLSVKQFNYWLIKYRKVNQVPERKPTQWLAFEVRDDEINFSICAVMCTINYHIKLPPYCHMIPA